MWAPRPSSGSSWTSIAATSWPRCVEPVRQPAVARSEIQDAQRTGVRGQHALDQRSRNSARESSTGPGTARSGLATAGLGSSRDVSRPQPSARRIGVVLVLEAREGCRCDREPGSARCLCLRVRGRALGTGGAVQRASERRLAARASELPGGKRIPYHARQDNRFSVARQRAGLRACRWARSHD